MTYEMYCKDAGAACRGHVKADDEQEFQKKLLDHLAKKHKVQEPNDTLVDYLMNVTREAPKKDLKI